MAGQDQPGATGPVPEATEEPAPFEPLPAPELIFAVTGAIGTDLSLVCGVLKEILREVQYEDAEVIRLSDLLRSIDGNQGILRTPVDIRTEGLMDAGDTLRRALNRGDAVALLGIPEIRARRTAITGNAKKPAPRKAYILHSLKRPEEARTLRRIYGRAFHLIAAFANRESRVGTFAARVAESRHEFEPGKYRKVAEKLVRRDEMDATKTLGQDVRDTFQRAVGCGPSGNNQLAGLAEAEIEAEVSKTPVKSSSGQNSAPNQSSGGATGSGRATAN